MRDDLIAAIRDRRAILFAGAGVSMTVGLPSWSTLIEQMARELGLDPKVSAEPDTNYFTLAEYYRLTKGSIGPLRSWMDRNWSIPEETLKTSRVHALIARLDFPLIYTTNFDRNLETAFALHGKDFVKIVTAKDVAQARDGVTQIVKLHGDFDDDPSIVIAETDYLERLSFESPLDIKFRADALGRPILFVGYSMSDLNIRFLLHRLWRTWQASGYEKDRPQSYVFMLRPNAVDEAVLEQWGIRVLTEPDCKPEEALETFLEKLADERRPARLAGAVALRLLPFLEGDAHHRHDGVVVLLAALEAEEVVIGAAPRRRVLAAGAGAGVVDGAAPAVLVEEHAGLVEHLVGHAPQDALAVDDLGVAPLGDGVGHVEVLCQPVDVAALRLDALVDRAAEGRAFAAVEKRSRLPVGDRPLGQRRGQRGRRRDRRRRRLEQRVEKGGGGLELVHLAHVASGLSLRRPAAPAMPRGTRLIAGGASLKPPHAALHERSRGLAGAHRAACDGMQQA